MVMYSIMVLSLWGGSIWFLFFLAGPGTEGDQYDKSGKHFLRG